MSRNHGKKLRPTKLKVIQAAAVPANYMKVGDLVESDAAEIASTDTNIVATGTSALAGDYVVFTSGTLLGESRLVDTDSANSFTVATAFSGAPTAGDTFDLYRPVAPQDVALLYIDNGTNQRLLFSLDGVDAHLTVKTSGDRTLDLRSNCLRLGDDRTNQVESDTRQFLWVKAESTLPTTGDLYIEYLR